MIKKRIFTLGIISLIIFIGLASYLWYLYFKDYENKLLSQDENLTFIRNVEFVNSGAINYINATNNDDDNIIPIYYFRVKNNDDGNSYNYTLYIENVTANDGCTLDTTFAREELEYELKLDNKVIKNGNLGTINNNVLDINTINKSSSNDYSLKIWLKSDITNYANKHFHYIVTMKETK